MDTIAMIVEFIKFVGVLLVESFRYDGAFDQFEVWVEVLLQSAIVLGVMLELDSEPVRFEIFQIVVFQRCGYVVYKLLFELIL